MEGGPFQSGTTKAERKSCHRAENKSWTHPPIVNTRLAKMTLNIAEFTALAMWRLRYRLRYELLLLLGLFLAGFD